MWTCVGVLALAACAFAITRDQLYPYGPALDQKLPKGLEVSSPETYLKVPVVFYGKTYDSLFVNNFGVVTFRADILSFINTKFPLPYPSIAAFYTNVDTTEEGSVYFRETNESRVISKAEESVQNIFHEYYDFKPTSVFIATWIDVPFTSDTHHRKNSYQVAIISNGTESFVELLYPERDIQWIQRETQPNVLPDAKAQVGFIAEDGRMFTLRGSGSHQIRNIVSWSNAHEPGKYVFRIGVISPDENVAVPDEYDQNKVEVEEESKMCSLSGPSVCHMQARCVDYQAGICCQCNEGYYGNGRSCIKDDIPLKVHGKLNGIINEIHLNDVDLQAYVVVADGRAYTALSLAPRALGSSLQLLNFLGGVVGWLFAIPSGNAKNGYQLTGAVFNHTADIWFPASNDRVIVQQEFYGHDVFDQITTEIDVRGTLPDILIGMKLEVSEFEEQYTVAEPGIIRSVSMRTFSDKITGAKYEARILQTFSFQPCRYAPMTVESALPLILKVSKNYLGYETKENIVRYETSNKIVPISQEDPCIVDRETCDLNSSCVVQGDSFTCIIKKGFTNIYQKNVLVCFDIDECVAGTHNCDGNAKCINHDGGFQCRCKEGFNGDGISCTKRSDCQEMNCNINAQCLESVGGPICMCNPGYTGDGSWCWKTSEYACARCSPYASCSFSSASDGHTCQCNEGYSGDGYQCLKDLKQSVISSTIPIVSALLEFSDPDSYPSTSDAPATAYTNKSYYTYESTTIASKEAKYNKTFILPICGTYGCICPQGYVNYRDERDNDLCSLESYSVVTSSTENHEPSNACVSDAQCPPNAVCSLGSDTGDASYMGHCVCPDGYVGDTFECIEHTEPNCSCGLNAHCVDTTAGEFFCVCDSGYQNDGYLCRPNFSCSNDSDCEYNAECKLSLVSGEYICQCIEGYIKDNNDACIQDGKLCNGISCAEHASCVFDDKIIINYCHCDDGYDGDGISQCIQVDPKCDITNNCSIYALVDINTHSIDIDECVSGTHNCDGNAECINIDGGFQCRCKEGFNGDGISCTKRSDCQERNCNSNAQCLESVDGPICMCNPGYTGDGSWCWNTSEYACARCSPYASCSFSSASDGHTCQCNEGYSGDGYQCVKDLKQSVISSTIPIVSALLESSDPDSYPSTADAPATAYTNTSYYTYESTTIASKEAKYNKTFILPICGTYGCICPQGYVNYRDERDNDLCSLESYSVVTSSTENHEPSNACVSDAQCPPNAVCSLGSDTADASYTGHCVCPDGYVGDTFECIEHTEPNCSCGLNAHCVDTTAGEFFCVCDSGYQNDGYLCRPNFSCSNDSDCEYNAECKLSLVSGEYICQCIEGYIKDNNDACIQDGKLCNGISCAEHASCVFDDKIIINYCHCDDGYDGDGISQCVQVDPKCEITNNCSIYDECISGTHNCDGNAECINIDGGFQCRCKEGFNGDGISCTKRSDCQERNCNSNAQCLESVDGPICMCNPGYTGDGSWCWNTSVYACARCSPYASCSFSSASDGHTCQCNEGYSGDGYQCVKDLKQSVISSTIPMVSALLESSDPDSYPSTSDAPATAYTNTSYYTYESTTIASKEAKYNKTFILPICGTYGCICPQGYVNYRDERDNDLCSLESYSVVTSSTENHEPSNACVFDAQCLPNAVCSLGSDTGDASYTGHCVCPDGYVGDTFECIEHTEPNCSCGLNAHCVDTTAGEFFCVCDSGYQNDGYLCRPNFSCSNDSDCEYNAECKLSLVSGEYICQCNEGYIKDNNDACIQDGKLCNGISCAEHASCVFDDKIIINYCHCDDGYDGDGISQCVQAGQTCNAMNDCSMDATCSLIESSYQCVCNDGFNGDGYICTPDQSCRRNPYLCSPEASCLNRNDGYVCECNSGYIGDGFNCESKPKTAW